MKHKTDRLAFTLMELLIAIAIIGILASFFFLVLNPARQVEKANTAQYSVKRNEVQKALTQFVIEEGGVASFKPDNLMGSNMTPVCRYGTTEIEAVFEDDGFTVRPIPCVIIDDLVDDEFIADLPEIAGTEAPYSGYYAKIDCKNRIGVTYDGDPNPPPPSCDCGIRPKAELVMFSDISGSFYTELSVLSSKIGDIENLLTEKGYDLINWEPSHGLSSIYGLNGNYGPTEAIIDTSTCPGGLCASNLPANRPEDPIEAWGLGLLWVLTGRVWHPFADQHVVVIFADSLPAGSNGFFEPYQNDIANALVTAINNAPNTVVLLLHGDLEFPQANVRSIMEQVITPANMYEYDSNTAADLYDQLAAAINERIPGCDDL